MKQADGIVADSLDFWQERLPEFDAETISAKYKDVSGEPMTPAEVAAWEKIRKLTSRFRRSDRIVMGGTGVEFLFPLQTKAAS
jgi:FMN-dependent NADH-azoreductase